MERAVQIFAVIPIYMLTMLGALGVVIYVGRLIRLPAAFGLFAAKIFNAYRGALSR